MHSIKKEGYSDHIGIALTEMARYLILSGSNDHKSKRLLVTDPSFNNIYNMVASLKKPYDEENISRFLSCEAQKQFITQPSSYLLHLAKGYLLYSKIPSESNCPYDIDSKMIEYFNISVLEFLACGFYELISSVGQSKERDIEILELKKFIGNKRKVFLDLNSLTAEEYRQEIRGKENKNNICADNDIYKLDPFIKKPFLKVKNSSIKDLNHILPQPIFLLKKISFGIFHLLSERERTNKGNNFRDKFGTYIYENYIERLFCRITSPIKFINLDKDYSNKSGFNNSGFPDFIIISNNKCILLEVKTSILTVNTRTLFDETYIKQEVLKEGGHIKDCIKKFCNFRKELSTLKKEQEFQNINTIMSAIICFDEVYEMNSSILPIIEKECSEKDLCNNLQFFSAEDLELFSTFLTNEPKNIDIIFDKLKKDIPNPKTTLESLSFFSSSCAKVV